MFSWSNSSKRKKTLASRVAKLKAKVAKVEKIQRLKREEQALKKKLSR